MDKGRIEQSGTPQDVYDRPQTAFVHEFIGETIKLPVIVLNNAVHFEGRSIGLDPQGTPDGSATLFTRPFNMTILPQPETNSLHGEVRGIHGIGPARRIEIALSGSPTVIEVDALRSQTCEIGQVLHLRPAEYRLFSNEL
jgi:sulfate transport system ATP-binding protein